MDASQRRATLTRNGKRLMAEIATPAEAVFELRAAAPPDVTGQGRRKLAIRLTGVKKS
jgi:hypothetical protein